MAAASSEPEAGSIEPLQRLNQVIPQLFFASPAQVIEAFSTRTAALAAQREADVHRTGAYAESLLTSDAEEREQFFSNIILLVDRQPDNVARYEVLCFLSELAAIETDPQRPADSVAFGHQALQTLTDIMPSVVGIGEPLKKAVKLKLVLIVDDMTPQYVLAVLPTLIEMVKDPKNGDVVASEFFEITDQLVDVFKYTVILMNGKVLNTEDTSEGVVVHIPGSPDADPPFNEDQRITVACDPQEAFTNICELMAVCAKLDDTALWYHEERISYLLNVEKIHLINNPDMLKEMAVHRLMGAMARHCEAAADTFTYPEKKEKTQQKKRPFIFESLIFQVRTIEDRNRSSKQRPQQAALQAMADAELMSCMFSIMSTGRAAAAWMADNLEINANTFINTIIKIARNSERAPLIAAAMDGLVILATTKNEDLVGKFQNVLEKECDIANKLQEIMRNLLTNKKNWTDAHRAAMISCLNLMTIYSKNREISSQLNESDFDGYDRESIIFGLLDATEDYVSEDVKLAAAETLRVVPLDEFDKSEIRDVVNMLSSIPSLVSTKTYDTISNMMFLMFKMAMDGDDSPGAKDADEGCGHVFRSIYATEVVSAVFGNIDRAMEGDRANASQPVEERKRRFETACVKFLMTGWAKPQLRQGLDAPAVVKTLVKTMQTEQTMLAYINADNDRERFQTHEHLFLEQTYVGFDVRALLQCISSLRQRDIIAFRIYHQLANVLQGVQNTELLDQLVRVAEADDEGFDVWHYKLTCGYEVYELAYLESLDWPDHMDVLRTTYPIMPALDGHARLLAGVQVAYWRHAYREANREPQITKWETLLAEARRDNRMVHFVMVDDPQDSPERDKVVAFIGGGPFRRNRRDKECEMYGLYVNPTYDKQREEIQQAMLAYFSHAMYLKGYTSCKAFVHKQERGLYDSTGTCQWFSYRGTRGVNFTMSPVESSGAAELAAAADVGPAGAPDSGGKNLLLVGWPLRHNIWRNNLAHHHFLAEDGIDKAVKFLAKGDSQTLLEFDPRVIEDTLSTSIREQLEDFGPELMKELDPAGASAGARSKDLAELMRSAQKPDTSQFPVVLEGYFKQPESLALIDGYNAPGWDAQIDGSADENFLQSLTLSLDAGQTMLPVPELKIAQRKKKAKRKGRKRKETKKLFMLPYMGVQTAAVCAAMFRGFYMLLRAGNNAIKVSALETLRDPVVFHAMRSVVSSIGYGIRESVNDASGDPYNVCVKFLHIIQEIIYIYPRGLDESLVAVELFEVLKQVIEDIFARLVSLLASRNEGTRDPLHRTRSLRADEERLIAKACMVCAELLNQVAYIQFFSGTVSVATIYSGNVKCRQFALSRLFGGSSKFRDSLRTFLLYDVEMASSLRREGDKFVREELERRMQADMHGDDDDEEDVQRVETDEDKRMRRVRRAAQARNMRTPEELESGVARDDMKVQIMDILGQMCSFDADFKRDFIDQFTRGAVMAELSLRPSFVQGVLGVAVARQLRARLEHVLVTETGLFTKDGEVIVDHAFVVHNDLNTIRLLVLSSEFYYLSSEPFTEETLQLALADESLLSLANMQRRSYSQVTRLSRGHSEQIFAVARRLGTPKPREQISEDVFLARRIGEAARLVRNFSRLCVDDLSQQLRVHDASEFTQQALAHVYQERHFRRGVSGSLNYTHCHIIHGKKREDRVLVWTAPDQLLVLEPDLSKWNSDPNKGSPTEYLRFVKQYKLSELRSIEFTATPRPILVLTWKRKSLTVLFKCDTAREQWRRQFKLFLANYPDWVETVLPDLHEQDRHTRKVV